VSAPGASTLPRLQILAAALLFSTGGTAIKACALTGWQVASFRSGIAAIALLLLLPESRGWWRPRPLLVGVAYATTMVAYVTANKLTTAANTIFLQSTAPLYLLLLGPLVLGERIRRSDFAFTVMLALGMAMFFVGVEPPRETAPDPTTGNLIGALCGVSWAVTILGLRWLGRDPSPEAPTAAAASVAGNILACLVALPFALPVVESTAGDWVAVGYLGVFQIGLAYVFLTRGVRHVPSLEVSLLLLLEPVTSALWAWLLLGERPAPWSLAGCLTILGSTVFFSLLGRRRR
jgi:drug/metabolite transporter (DMT)-like permease